MSYRKFKLINAVGAEYDLNDLSHALYSPDGLGFSRNISSVQVGSAFVLTDNKLVQQTIKGEMRFKSYEEYSEFKEFISGSSLTLAYQPKDFDVWYYRSVEVQRLDKTEIDKTARCLICAIDFLCLSQWYESVIAEKTVPEIDENSVFPLVFPFVFCDRDINEVRINNPHSEPAPCRIEISGPCINPRWQLLNGGEVKADGKVNISVMEGETLIIDANVESLGITKQSEDEETNAYQLSDFGTDRFIYAPTGRSVLRFFDDSSEALDITVEVKIVSDTV